MRRLDYPQLGEQCYLEQLENGLCVLVVSKPGYAKAMAMLAVSYGGMDVDFLLDGVPQSTPEGIAHYLEHKMFEMKGGSALTQLSRNGASVNAYTAKDITAYHFSCTQRFQENLRTLVRFVTTGYFTPESVAKERGIIGQEIRMYRDNPAHRVYENLLRGLYLHHPLRRSILGTEESVGTITADTLSRLHAAFYTPRNMVLVAVGDVDPREVAETARMVFQPGELHRMEKRFGPPEPPEAAQERVQEEMDVPEPTFLLGCKAEPFPQGEEGLRRSLLGSVAAELLCGQSSPLYARLYNEGLIHEDFFAGCIDYPGAAALVLGGDSPDPEAVTAAVLQEAVRIQREGLEEERFRRVVRSEYGAMVRSLNSFDNLCASLVRGWFAGYNFYDFPRLYASLTREDAMTFLAGTVERHRSCLSMVTGKGGSEG